ncbi:MAG: glycosidase [Planctomycetota bacterium]
MADNNQKELFIRHPGNPIITAKDLPYPANTVFNAGATKFGDETLLLMRVEDRRGMSHLTVARSKDGISGWEIDKQPTMPPSPEAHPEELYGIEDARITFLEEKKKWAIVYTAFSRCGPLVALATTTDFKTFERLGPVMPPEDKDAALFPVRFDGRWALIHRPATSFEGVGAHIWMSYSPDLKHWGDHIMFLEARRGAWWDANRIGLSPQPLRTDKGWLIMYHGVRRTAAGCIYRLGLALLDLEDPSRVIRRSDEWVFSPEEDYERTGDVNEVVFPCGWVREGDEIRLYYGGADTCIALATASLSGILRYLG